MTVIAHEPQPGGLGAVITGVNLTQPLNKQVISEIKQILWKFHLVIFRDQKITPDQQIRFGKYFGPVVKHPYIRGLEGYPEIMVVEKKRPINIILRVLGTQIRVTRKYPLWRRYCMHAKFLPRI
tara:strand:+ start:10422 stop:10793 length:372 start_codon:yes stop_codon:yes gene_type:complete